MHHLTRRARSLFLTALTAIVLLVAGNGCTHLRQESKHFAWTMKVLVDQSNLVDSICEDVIFLTTPELDQLGETASMFFQ